MIVVYALIFVCSFAIVFCVKTIRDLRRGQREYEEMLERHEMERLNRWGRRFYPNDYDW